MAKGILISESTLKKFFRRFDQRAQSFLSDSDGSARGRIWLGHALGGIDRGCQSVITHAGHLTTTPAKSKTKFPIDDKSGNCMVGA